MRSPSAYVEGAVPKRGEDPALGARAVELGIDYLWVDEDDDVSIGERLASRPDLFGQVFRRNAVRVFDVRPNSGGTPRGP